MKITSKSLFVLIIILPTFFLSSCKSAIWKQKTVAKEAEKPLNGPHAPSSLEMVLLKGSCFRMGNFIKFMASDALPVHKVCLDDFYIGKYEVTVGSYRKFVDETSYVTEVEIEGKGMVLNATGDNWEEREGISWRNPGFEQNENHPVVMVSWNDAMAYIKWLNEKSGLKYRLPTEAEWEFAAREGGKFIEYAWGNEQPDGNVAGDEYKNHFPNRSWPVWKGYDDSFVFTAPVGSFKSNMFDLYDMSGNVWEWCADWYNLEYYASSPVDNPKGPVKGTHRVFRGGSWYSKPSSLRTGLRDAGTPNEKDFYIGFRLSRSPEEEAANAKQ